MQYRLICKGRLVEGTDEAKAVVKLKKLTGLSTEQIVERLLSGRTVKLKSSDDKARIDGLYQVFQAIGLDVEVITQPEPVAGSETTTSPSAETEAPGQDESQQAETPTLANAAEAGPDVAAQTESAPFVEADAKLDTAKTPAATPPTAAVHTGGRSRVGIAAALLLLLVAAVVGYGWYWLRSPLPAGALDTEQALADGRLVSIGHINVEKLVQLQRYLFGELDTAALPIDGKQQDLLTELFDGPAGLREHLSQAFFAVHGSDQPGVVHTALVLDGRFEAGPVIQALSSAYRVDKSSDGRWASLHVLEDKAQPVCPDETPKGPRQRPMHLLITPERMLLVSDPRYGEQLMQRLQQQAVAVQDIAQWQDYRAGQLASLMVFSTRDSSLALDGFAGMAARSAAGKNTELSSLAAGLAVDLAVPGLNFNLLLGSEDETWRRDTRQGIQQGLDEIMHDSRKFSPTLGGMFSRLSVAEQPQAVTIDLAVDGALLDDLGEVIEEGIASLFSVEVRDANQTAGDQADQIDTQPTDYSTGAALADLPALKIESYQQEPLYRRGAFGIDLERIKLDRDTGGLTLNVQGMVALPKSSDQSHNRRIGDLSMTISTVEDAEGRDLRRDERCVKNIFYGGGYNHQPSTQGSLFGDKGQINKEVRLLEGVKAEDIARIKGQITLTAPVAVKRFTLPLQAGESIEFAGMRFYLSAVKERGISYQVSGASERFLELRALNADGKPLKKGWRVGDTDGGRATQDFKGRVHGLEIYVAERIAEHQLGFVLQDLFKPGKESNENRPAWHLAPAFVDHASWKPYEKLDMAKLNIDPAKWQVYDRNKAPIADQHWPGLSLYVTHTPKQWGNHPQAHVYYPMVPELPGVLSALAYHIADPAEPNGPGERYKRVHYPYYANSGERVVRHELDGLPLALGEWSLEAGLKENETLTHLKGELVFRLPLSTDTSLLELKDLWSGVTVDGVTVTLTDVSRGMFPGYGLQIEGDLSRLVNLHGLGSDGQRVMADPINYQDGGYWTMTLPFGKGIEQVELILASEQKVLRYPFDFKPVYPD